MDSSTQARIERARQSFTGLTVGDAFGQTFFIEQDEAERRADAREWAEGTWLYTDDTLMGLAVLETLEQTGRIDQDFLAKALGLRYAADRGFGPAMHRLLTRVREGEDWRVVAREQFEGQGSMGNGSALRAGVVGAYFADDPERAAAEARLSSVVTHTHAEGVAGAVAVALAAAWACRTPKADQKEFLGRVAEGLPASRVRQGVLTARDLGARASIRLAVSALGNGTGLSAPDTVPLALWSAARCMGNFEEGMWLTIAALGDRDTTCAITGSVLACTGRVPEAWVDRVERVGGVRGEEEAGG